MWGENIAAKARRRGKIVPRSSQNGRNTCIGKQKTVPLHLNLCRTKVPELGSKPVANGSMVNCSKAFMLMAGDGCNGLGGGSSAKSEVRRVKAKVDPRVYASWARQASNNFWKACAISRCTCKFHAYPPRFDTRENGTGCSKKGQACCGFQEVC